MAKYESEMIDILNALNESGMLPNCVICGSWSMFFYKHIFEGFIPPIATTDLDIFLPNISKIKDNNISHLLTEIDYIREDDYLTGKTRYYSKAGFDIEFLTTPNRTMSHVIKIKAGNIGAEALPKMVLAGWNYMQVDYNSITVNVVSPVSFILQKLLINKERTPEYKKEKDIDAVRYILDFVKASRKYSEELKQSFESCPKKWKKSIKETTDKYNIDLGLE